MYEARFSKLYKTPRPRVFTAKLKPPSQSITQILIMVLVLEQLSRNRNHKTKREMWPGTSSTDPTSYGSWWKGTKSKSRWSVRFLGEPQLGKTTLNRADVASESSTTNILLDAVDSSYKNTNTYISQRNKNVERQKTWFDKESHNSVILNFKNLFCMSDPWNSVLPGRNTWLESIWILCFNIHIKNSMATAPNYY